MIETKHNKKDALEMPALGMKLSDIFYVLFRQKWIIAGCLAAGLIAGIIVFLAQKTLYWSETKLLVLYVTQIKSMETADGAKVRTAEVSGEAALNSEMEMLTSLDLCEEIAKRVGPERILGKNGGSNATLAAAAIYEGIKLENPRRSNIIKVRFSHSDPTVCQVVLRQLIDSYFKRHVKIFHTEGVHEDALMSEANRLQGLIAQDEDELSKLNFKARVNSLEEDKKNYIEQLALLRREVGESLAKLAEYRVLSGSEPVAAKGKETPEAAIPPAKVKEYKLISALLDSMRESELRLTLEYTDEYPQLVTLRQQIGEQEKKKKALEAEFPALANVYVAPVAGGTPGNEGRISPRQVLAAEAKLSTLSNQVAALESDLAVLKKEESAIGAMKRKLELDTGNYRRLMSEIESIRRSEAIANVKSNIQAVQNPSAPAPNVSQRLKFVAGTFAGFLLGGIALAFFIEFFVDHTIRRPGEFEAKVKLPLFLSIPRLGLNGHSRLLPFPVPAADPGDGTVEEEELKQTWAADHPLRRYIDGLRDATLTHFGGDPHKPKLIGITSCGEQSGVTSIAAGLAGALSETGDGNVLLLNLNYEAEAAHPFYRGELACGLADALEMDKRVNGKVLQNLYVATAGNPNDPATQSLPRQLARIVPKLRVCDYDYIIFDLPPTTPTTMTARLAGMMDLVILVVESEKDTQDSVKQAARLLARSKASVSAVLNKVRDPVPKWLQQGT